jgi:hypothetical protein
LGIQVTALLPRLSPTTGVGGRRWPRPRRQGSPSQPPPLGASYARG